MYENHHRGEKPFKKPTVRDMDEVLYGSASYTQTEKLDIHVINVAIKRCLMPYDWKIEEYSNTDATKDVVEELREAGFTKIYSDRSIISYKNDKFKVVRPEKNPDMFVAVEEKRKERGQVECHYLIK